jgi:hypothetical protein
MRAAAGRGHAESRASGLATQFFELLGPCAPPPPVRALPPLLWGTEEHVRALFSDRAESLEMTRTEYVERSVGGPEGYRALLEATFGPVIAIRASLADDPDRAAALDRDFREFTSRGNRGAPGGPADYPYEVLLVLARKGRW